MTERRGKVATMSIGRKRGEPSENNKEGEKLLHHLLLSDVRSRDQTLHVYYMYIPLDKRARARDHTHIPSVRVWPWSSSSRISCQSVADRQTDLKSRFCVIKSRLEKSSESVYALVCVFTCIENAFA